MKKKNVLLRISMLLVVGLAFLIPLNTFAQEDHSETSAKWVTKTLSDVTISDKFEDSITIDEKRYQYNGKTIFIKKMEKKEVRVALSDISLPCLARITYRVITQQDEANPYLKSQRILTKVYIY